MSADDDKSDKSNESAIKSVIAQRGVVAGGSALSKYRIGEQAVPEQRLPFPSLRSGSLPRVAQGDHSRCWQRARITNVYIYTHATLHTLRADYGYIAACEPQPQRLDDLLRESLPSSANGPGLLADFFLIWINNDTANNSALNTQTVRRKKLQ
jgi:hypothetical protein